MNISPLVRHVVNQSAFTTIGHTIIWPCMTTKPLGCFKEVSHDERSGSVSQWGDERSGSVSQWGDEGDLYLRSCPPPREKHTTPMAIMVYPTLVTYSSLGAGHQTALGRAAAMQQSTARNRCICCSWTGEGESAASPSSSCMITITVTV